MTGLKYWLTVNFLQRKFLLKNCPLKKKSQSKADRNWPFFRRQWLIKEKRCVDMLNLGMNRVK